MIYLMCSFERANLSGIIDKIIFLDSSMVEHSAVNRVVVGSSPTRGAIRISGSDHWFLSKLIRRHGQAVKTPPFHGGIRGSNPLGVIE